MDYSNCREIEFNDDFNKKINEVCEKLSIDLQIKKKKLKWEHRGLPDGVGFCNKIARLIIEYKLIRTYKGSTIQRGICQDLCYTYDRYKLGIVPIRLHLIITEQEIIGIKFDKYELLYENFGILREKYSCCASKLYDTSEDIRELLKDSEQLADFRFPLKDIDLEKVINTIYDYLWK